MVLSSHPIPFPMISSSGPHKAEEQHGNMNDSHSNSNTIPKVYTPETTSDDKVNSAAHINGTIESHSQRVHGDGSMISDQTSRLIDECTLASPGMTTTYDFPAKLHKMLTDSEAEGNDHIFSWLPHGKAFRIHKRKEFVSIILPKYYYHVKLKSFLRQLNLYGLKRETNKMSAEYNSYRHECLIRGQPGLVSGMTRTTNKSAAIVKPSIIQRHSDRNTSGKHPSISILYPPYARGAIDYFSLTHDKDVVRGDQRLSSTCASSVGAHQSSSLAQPNGRGNMGIDREKHTATETGVVQSAATSTKRHDVLRYYYQRHHHQQLQVIEGKQEKEEMDRFQDILMLFLSPSDVHALEQKVSSGKKLDSSVEEKIRHILNDLEPNLCF